jgi:predicted small lipoprotein YifL
MVTPMPFRLLLAALVLALAGCGQPEPKKIPVNEGRLPSKK